MSFDGYINMPFYELNNNLQPYNNNNNESNFDSHVEMPTPIKNWDHVKFVNYIMTVFFKRDDVIDKEFCLENAMNYPNLPDLLTNLRLDDFLKIDTKYGARLHASLIALNNKYLRQNAFLQHQNLNQLDINNNNNNQNVPTTMDFINNSSSGSIDSSSDSDDMDDKLDNYMPFLPSNSFDTQEQTHFKRNNNLPSHQVVPKQKKTKDCLHVWQFCRDLLSNKETDIVEWIDPKNGIFKVNNKDEFARKWGQMKNRKDPTKMSYENMSRGMRHSRKESGYFKYPEKKKKFVYQFGEKAVESCEWLKSLSQGLNV